MSLTTRQLRFRNRGKYLRDWDGPEMRTSRQDLQRLIFQPHRPVAQPLARSIDETASFYRRRRLLWAARF